MCKAWPTIQSRVDAFITWTEWRDKYHPRRNVAREILSSLMARIRDDMKLSHARVLVIGGSTTLEHFTDKGSAEEWWGR